MNVCPREGVAYDSYYNETDRVIWLAEVCHWHLLPRQNFRWHLLPIQKLPWWHLLPGGMSHLLPCYLPMVMPNTKVLTFWRNVISSVGLA